MRRWIQEIADDLMGFVRQRKAHVLVIVGGAVELAVTAMALRKIDASSADLVFTWTHDFVSARAWVDVLREHLGAQHRALMAEGLVPPGVTPPEAGDPVGEVRGWMAYARALRPDAEGTVVLWSMLPVAVTDARAYREFVTAVLARGENLRLWRGLRAVVRGDPRGEIAAEIAGSMQRVVDGSPAAMEAMLARDVDDDTLPLAERLTALTVLAGVDLARGDLAMAIDAYGVLEKYHSCSADPAPLAIARAGLAEACLRAGRWIDARRWYEAAMAPAEAGGAWPVVLSSATRLAEMAGRDQRHSEASTLWEGAARIARALGLPSEADHHAQASMGQGSP